MSQSAARADELFASQQYKESLAIYESLHRSYPQNQLYTYRMARCLQETGKTEASIAMFEEAGERYALRIFDLAQLYAKTYRFEAAAACAEKFMASVSESNDRYADAVKLSVYAHKCARYMRRVEDICIVDSVTVPKGDLLGAYKLSHEGGSLQAESRGIAYISARGDRKIIGSEGKILSCQRLLDEWSECDTLPSPVNGEYNAMSPFMLSDGVTMYFASDSEEGLGGYDIYETRYNSTTDSWLKPENAGFPFNSSANDYMYAVDEQQGLAWFATDRFTSPDSVAVYTLRLNEEKRVLRDTTEDYIRLAAQLVCFRYESDRPLQTAVTDIADESTSSDADSLFTIVINDSTIYTSVKSFRNADARQLAAEYASLSAQLAEEEESLSQMRISYRESESAEQKEKLRGVMLTQEKTVRTLRKEQKTLLKQIKGAERD